MGKESTRVWAPLQAEFKRLEYQAQRIEDKFYKGIPDVNVHFTGIGDIWLELKYAEPNACGSIEIGLSPEQYIWLWEGSRAGRNCFLVAVVGSGWWLWADARAWNLAKRVSQWSELKSYGRHFAGAPALVEYLRVWFNPSPRA